MTTDERVPDEEDLSAPEDEQATTDPAPEVAPCRRRHRVRECWRA